MELVYKLTKKCMYDLISYTYNMYNTYKLKIVCIVCINNIY